MGEVIRGDVIRGSHQGKSSCISGGVGGFISHLVDIMLAGHHISILRNISLSSGIEAKASNYIQWISHWS